MYCGGPNFQEAVNGAVEYIKHGTTGGETELPDELESFDFEIRYLTDQEVAELPGGF